MPSEMIFCKKIFTAALCVLILLPDSGCARHLWKRALHLKMTEKYDVSSLRWGDFGELGVLTLKWELSLCVCIILEQEAFECTASLYKRAVLSFPGCAKLLPPSCCNGNLVKHAENIRAAIVTAFPRNFIGQQGKAEWGMQKLHGWE